MFLMLKILKKDRVIARLVTGKDKTMQEFDKKSRRSFVSYLGKGAVGLAIISLVPKVFLKKGKIHSV